jgi:hypothetical protein
VCNKSCNGGKAYHYSLANNITLIQENANTIVVGINIERKAIGQDHAVYTAWLAML